MYNLPEGAAVLIGVVGGKAKRFVEIKSVKLISFNHLITCRRLSRC